MVDPPTGVLSAARRIVPVTMPSLASEKSIVVVPPDATTTAVQAPSFSLTLDHPFLYAIRDNQTGELLFIGTMMNPS